MKLKFKAEKFEEETRMDADGHGFLGNRAGPQYLSGRVLGLCGRFFPERMLFAGVQASACLLGAGSFELQASATGKPQNTEAAAAVKLGACVRGESQMGVR